MKKNSNLTVYRHLLTIKGIGNLHANLICESLGISNKTKLTEISNDRFENLNRLIANLRKNASPGFKFNIGHSLSKEWESAIQRLIMINSHRGRRIKQGYPARGQRTRSNAVTSSLLRNRRSRI